MGRAEESDKAGRSCTCTYTYIRSVVLEYSGRVTRTQLKQTRLAWKLAFSMAEWSLLEQDQHQIDPLIVGRKIIPSHTYWPLYSTEYTRSHNTDTTYSVWMQDAGWRIWISRFIRSMHEVPTWALSGVSHPSQMGVVMNAIIAISVDYDPHCQFTHPKKRHLHRKIPLYPCIFTV